MLLLLTDSLGSQTLLSLLEPRSVLKPSRLVHSMSLRERVQEAWTQLAPKTLGRRTAEETQSRPLTPLVSLWGQSCSCWWLWEPRTRGDLGRLKILSSSHSTAEWQNRDAQPNLPSPAACEHRPETGSEASDGELFKVA